MRTQGDELMAAKVARQATGNTGARDANYEEVRHARSNQTQTDTEGPHACPRARFSRQYDNDANFHAQLNSHSAEYVSNIDTEHSAEMTVDRWKSGGGIQVGENDKPGGMGGIHAGRRRDVDGTIDRVKDPPKELLPLLYSIRASALCYNIDLYSVFEEAGGSGYGMIPTQKFSSALVVALHRMPLTEHMLTALADAYGCGTEVPSRSAYSRIAKFDSVAWKDFCEDVGKAEAEEQHPYPYGGPPELTKVKLPTRQ